LPGVAERDDVVDIHLRCTAADIGDHSRRVRVVEPAPQDLAAVRLNRSVRKVALQDAIPLVASADAEPAVAELLAAVAGFRGAPLDGQL
jgi:hypothetical protein